MIGSDRGANIELWARVPRLGRSVTIHHNSLQSALEAARIGRWISERRPGTAWQGGGRSRPGLGRRLTTTPPGEAWASRARQPYPRGLLLPESADGQWFERTAGGEPLLAVEQIGDEFDGMRAGLHLGKPARR